MNVCEMAIEILEKTRDGDELEPSHLKIVELAVNGFLNGRGKEEFKRLYEQVIKGYEKPWFHGIEHLTLDQRGFVYWKGIQVEHYNLDFVDTEKAREKAMELAERCKYLDESGVEVNVRNVIWNWEEFESSRSSR